jgi:addiction module HigA family antidote
MTEVKHRYLPEDRTPPGDSLAETLEVVGMSQAELAQRVGLSRKTVNEIVQGKAPISAETALKLETVLGTAASFWLNLDRNYQEFLARKAEREQFESEVKWLKRIPVKEMVQKEWLPNLSDLGEMLKAAMSFFGTASPELWENRWSKFKVRYRKSQVKECELGVLAAWLRKGELDGQQMATQPFDAEKFRAALAQIRTLTDKTPAVFQPEMRRLCAECGVAVVFTPELKGLRVSGATHWLTPDKALIQLSLRFKSDDHFWFTFFHEARHVLQAVKKEVFVEGLVSDDIHEKDADSFAADLLVPKQEYVRFVAASDFRETTVKDLAAKLQLAPGVLVGRLQHERAIGFDRLNHLKRRFEWATK